jgi:uncharacterized protein (DUF58 family)
MAFGLTVRQSPMLRLLPRPGVGLKFLRWFYRYRSLRLTPEGLRFLLLTLALGVAALNTGNNLLYLLLAMMLSLIVASGILSERCLKGLAIRRRLPRHIFAGRPAAGSLAVANEKRRFGSFSLKISECHMEALQENAIHLLHLQAGASTSQSYRVLFRKRGAYQIEGIKLSTRFPFGLFVKTATLSLPMDVVVYPDVKPLPETLVRDLKSLGYHRETPRRGMGSGLYNLRDYQVGDDSRSVHWKTSARQSRLMVRETEAEDQRMVTLALPTVAPDDGSSPDEHRDGFERAVELVASLGAYFHSQGFAIRLLLGSEEIPYGQGEAHFYRILRALAVCRTTRGVGRVPLPAAFLALAEQTAAGQLAVLVLPWEDGELRVACQGVNRIFEAYA